MTTLHLKILIPENRELKIELPEDFPLGEAQVTIEVPAVEVPWDERPWTEEEIKEFLSFTPSTLGEILDAGLVGAGAEDMEYIRDSAEWVEEMRQKEDERTKWTPS